MLEGITILDKYTQLTSYGRGCVLFGIIATIISGTFLGLIIQEVIKKRTIFRILGLIVCIAIFIGSNYLIYIGTCSSEPVYKVLISDEVSPTQLLEQFKIQGKEGLIYKIIPYITN